MKSTVLFLLLALSLIVITPSFVSAATPTQQGLDTTVSQANITKTSGLPSMIGRAINSLFGLMALVFLTVVLIGGYMWMTAGGNEESVNKAKKFILNGTFGIIVILLSYVFVFTIASSLSQSLG